MNRWGKIALAAGALVVAVVLFAVLRPSGDDDEAEPAAQTSTQAETTTEEAPATTETAPATTEATTTEATTTEETGTTTEEAGPQRVVVVVRNGGPVGGIVRAQVDEGDRVVLIVRSDIADEVHLHGYDLSTEVGPGQPARIQFTANLLGQFEVELEEHALEIAEIEVS